MKNLIFTVTVFIFSTFAIAQADPLSRLHTAGNHLVTTNGKTVALHGVSLCSVEWQNAPQGIDDVAGPGTQWHASVVRLPVQLKEWDRIGGLNHIHSYLDPAVAACDRANVYCIIDWHNISDWNKSDVVQKMMDFWTLVAPRYANNPHILYELFNEPIAPGDMNAANWSAYKKAADGWIAKVRAMAPRTVLLVGSPHWSQMPGFAPAAPLSDPNVIYVMHLYPNWPIESWNNLFGDASATLPIFISEWGWGHQDKDKKVEFYGTQKDFGEPLRTYLDAHPQISWTAWSYDKACGPAMLGGDKDLGDFVQGWLTELHDKKQ